MFLLDTDVLSLTNEATGPLSEAVGAWRAWVRDHRDSLYLSVVTLMEARFGIEKSRAKGATRKAEDLRRWLAAAETTHRARIVPVSAEIARTAGELLWRAVAAGVTPSAEDALIAAKAAVRGFTVLSRNGKHMGPLGVDWADPIHRLPPGA